MGKRISTSYYITYDGEEFPVECDPIDSTEIVQIKGNEAKIGYLSHDSDGVSGYYWTETDSGQYLNFDRRTIHSREFPDSDELKQLVRANPGRVFWVSKYEHGLVRYYRSGEAITVPNRHANKGIKGPGTSPADGRLIIPDQQWDVSRGVALYIAPDDTPDPAKYADSVLEEFSDWCNGSIYGVCVQKLTRADEDSEWEQVESDECWGFIGYEHAKNSLKEDYMPEEESVTKEETRAEESASRD
jgi:hypothetical protein